MLWKGLGLLTNSESPIVVVLRYVLLSLLGGGSLSLDFRSGSMEPAFYRGDLLFLTNPLKERYQTGDIPVYKIPGVEIPIVHRILKAHDVSPKASKGSKKSRTQV